MKIPVTQSQLRASAIFNPLHHARALGLLFLMIIFFALPALAQNITVRGRVTNETNQPVAGASVVVKGTTTGTTTNDNGQYELSAPANGTLVISSVGYPDK
ncbi:MAG TPA: carboxypeptidase-like regulatory domain-containing protein, partial [Flavisolibacter sp.]